MKNKVVDTKYAFVCIVVVLAMISLVTISLASNKVETSNENNYNISYYSGDDEEINNAFSEVDEENDKESIEINGAISEVSELIVPIKNARITAEFGKRVHPITNEEIFHSGVDVAAEKGEKVMAVADGIVLEIGFNSSQGNFVTIKHSDGTMSLYAHGSKILVSLNDKVEAGDVIMLAGATGMATGPHLHFEMQNEAGEYIDVNQLFE